MVGAAQARRRTRTVGVGLSLLVHAVVLSWLGLRAVEPRPPPEEPPQLTVELIRPLPIAAASPVSPRPRPAVAAPVEAVAPARPRPAAPIPRAAAPRPLPLPPIGSRAPSGALVGGGPGPAAGVVGGNRPAPGPLPGVELQGDLRGFLRSTVGCSHEQYLRLTAVERARCDAGFATALKTAPRIPLPDDKLAAFARQADANARKRDRQEGSLENTLPACDHEMVGSNLGFSCLPPQAHVGVTKF